MVHGQGVGLRLQMGVIKPSSLGRDLNVVDYSKRVKRRPVLDSNGGVLDVVVVVNESAA